MCLQTGWAESDQECAQPPRGTRLVKAVLASAPRGKQFWPKGWRAVPNEGSPCCGKQWSKTAPWLGSSHFENGWRDGSARIKRELLGRGGRAPKDTVKAGINCTDSHRFSLNPASFLLGSHISTVLLPHIPTKHQLVWHQHVKLAARTPCVFGPCWTLESCTGLRCRF